MDDDAVIAAEAEIRKQLIELWKRSGRDEIRQAALLLRRGGAPMDRSDLWTILLNKPRRQRGRPKADDRKALIEMGFLLAKKQARTLTDAARMVLGKVNGNSPDAKVHRLRLAYKKDRKSIEAEVNALVAIYRRHDEENRMIKRLKDEYAREQEIMDSIKREYALRHSFSMPHFTSTAANQQVILGRSASLLVGLEKKPAEIEQGTSEETEKNTSN